MDLILHFIILGIAIFLLARIMPGIWVKNLATALLVALVYGLINITLGSVLKFFALPFIFITVGLFLLLINTFLLWLTDQILDDFEIDNMTTTFAAAVAITLVDALLGFIF
ncbi:MAG: phage holin family protein [Pseudomonadales bacterium]|nr:phage holin family protein [Pseudomonadales bacterium]